MAFAHPEDRSKGSGRDLDRISVRDYCVDVEIGAFQVERETTQRLRFNIVVEVYPLDEDADDDVDRILSYDRITEAVDGELAAERLNLLETLSTRIADRILGEPQAARVFVRIEKLDRGPAILGVEIVRDRADDAPADLATNLPEPIVLYLGGDSAIGENLTRWVDAAKAQSSPVIICVPALEDPLKVAMPYAQRHVDALALEVAAWEASARDARCAVVGSRTELDWSMRQGRISIWAPAKILLDSVDAPDDLHNLAHIVEWFADQVGAKEILFVGTQPTGVRKNARQLAEDAFGF